ncbi:MAG: hypothetical protein V2J12_06680 [Gammaproteobacteria bacterium]|jgi:hypothetical protein|nr:hypothetical protein [Gammaproteobacteria bacterium]
MMEQTFFDDPAVDRLMRINLLLAAELHVTRDRLRAVEAVLEEQGLLDAARVEQQEFTAAQQAVADAERDRFVATLLAIAAGQDA